MEHITRKGGLDWKRMQVELKDLGDAEGDVWACDIVEIEMEPAGQRLTIKKVGDEVLIGIPAKSGYYRAIVINRKTDKVTVQPQNERI